MISTRMIVAAAALLLLTLRAHAGDDRPVTETPVFSGKDWHRLDRIDPDWGPTFKLFLVRGIYEGAYAVDRDNTYEQYGPAVTFRDLVKALDRFYADDRNDKIPVTYALALLSHNPSGSVSRALPIAERPAARRSLISVEEKDR